jgi:enoyl-CoA hydratase
MADLIAVSAHDGIALVRIQHPPANALAPGLLDEGAEVIAGLRSDAPAAVVLTGSGGFFSAGVDLKLAPTLTADEQRGMVAGINRMFCDWYGFPRPVVAAVNGHAVAGGLILALCADQRIGARPASYGLTELRVGAPYPVAALAVVRAELDPGPARRLVLGAELVDGEEALRLGLLDELADDEAAVLGRAMEVARDLAALPPGTYETVKCQLRGPELEAIRAGIERDPLAAGWLSDETAGAARSVLEGRSDAARPRPGSRPG